MDSPRVEALAEAVEELSEDVEAEALVEDPEEAEARERIAELEALANTSTGTASKSFAQKAEALRAEHGLTEEPGRYEVEALADQPDTEDAEAEALQQFRDKKAQREADEELPQEAQEMLSNLKNMREQAKQQGHKQLIERYTERIENLRAEHAE